MFVVLLNIFGCSTKKNDSFNNLEVVGSGQADIKNITQKYKKFMELQNSDVKEYVRSEAPDERNFKRNKTLTYKETEEYGENAPLDIYEDEFGARYYYNSEGIIISYQSNSDIVRQSTIEQSKNDGIAIDSKSAIDIAQKFAVELYGDYFVGFKYDNINNKGWFSSVTFNKKYGKDNFIVGESYTCAILATGAVNYCSITNPQNMEGFDGGQFENVSKKDVYEKCEEEINDVFEDNLVSFEVDKVNIKKYNDTFVIKADCKVILTNDEEHIETLYEVVLQP